MGNWSFLFKYFAILAVLLWCALLAIQAYELRLMRNSIFKDIKRVDLITNIYVLFFVLAVNLYKTLNLHIGIVIVLGCGLIFSFAYGFYVMHKGF